MTATKLSLLALPTLLAVASLPGCDSTDAEPNLPIEAVALEMCTSDCEDNDGEACEAACVDTLDDVIALIGDLDFDPDAEPAPTATDELTAVPRPQAMSNLERAIMTAYGHTMTPFMTWNGTCHGGNPDHVAMVYANGYPPTVGLYLFYIPCDQHDF